MTRTEARRVLGVAASASRAKIKQAYHGKLREHRLHQIPGNTLEQRQQAYQESVKANAAWNILSQPDKKQSQRPVRANAAKTAAKSSQHTQPKPPNMAEAWDSLVKLSPFSARTTTCVAVVIILIVIILLLSFLL